MKKLQIFFLLTDLGFIIYWLITLLHLIPQSLLFSDYNNPVLTAWNWSFLPLDMFISLTGISSLIFYHKKNDLFKKLELISLILTFCSGLQAISFWFLRNDFDLSWWGLNLYLVIYPLFFIGKKIKEK